MLVPSALVVLAVAVTAVTLRATDPPTKAAAVAVVATLTVRVVLAVRALLFSAILLRTQSRWVPV
jgi:hypothetical protein